VLNFAPAPAVSPRSASAPPPSFSCTPKTDAELSNAALANRLVELAGGEDGGKPKTGRRFWYLALSHGYVQPDMGDSAAAKASREAAQEHITKILGTLRKQTK
jgi:hypothetical protein